MTPGDVTEAMIADDRITHFRDIGWGAKSVNLPMFMQCSGCSWIICGRVPTHSTGVHLAPSKSTDCVSRCRPSLTPWTSPNRASRHTSTLSKKVADDWLRSR